MGGCWGLDDPMGARATEGLFGPARELVARALDLALLALVDAPTGGNGGDGDGPAHQHPTTTTPRVTSSPVVLVHGYGGVKTQWFLVEWALRRAGFSAVHAMEYDAPSSDVPALSERLCRLVRSLAAGTGADRVHLVGHSLGGVIIRHAVTVAGLDPLVGAAVTIASPHGGTRWAHAGTGATGAQLRPGSPVLRHLESSARPGQARWVAFYSDLDVIVAPDRARIRPAALAADNVMVPGEGHLSILLSSRLARGVVTRLASIERQTARDAASTGATGPSRPRPLEAA